MIQYDLKQRAKQALKTLDEAKDTDLDELLTDLIVHDYPTLTVQNS